MKESKNIVAIIACGLGTRMSAFTAGNYIPKLLTNVGGKTVLAKIYDKIEEQNVDAVDGYVIALPSQDHVDKVKQYCKENGLTRVEFVIHEKQNGSAAAVNTLIDSLDTNYDYNIVLHWCDVYLPDLTGARVRNFLADTDKRLTAATVCMQLSEKHLCLDYINGVVINSKQMSELVRNKLYAADDVQSIIGVYGLSTIGEYYTKLKQLLAEADGVDYARLMQSATQKIEPYNFETVETYGDAADYTKYCNAAVQEKIVRYFNDIKIDDDTVAKTSLTERGHVLIEREREWYRKCAKYNIDSIPTILESRKHFMLMTRIHGLTVKDYIEQFDPEYKCTPLAIGLLEMFEKAIKPIHDVIDYSENIAPALHFDIKFKTMVQEYVDTTLSRYNEISALVDNVSHFNGAKLPDIHTLCSDIKHMILHTHEVIPFVFLHGDPHAGNTMITDDGTELYFIDPRGYFGSDPQLAIGDIDYDISKFAFGLTGNTQFARMPYHLLKLDTYDNSKVGITADVLGYDIETLPLTNRQKFLVGLQWLKFGAWLKNNPAEAIIVHSYGLLMTRKYLDKYMQELRLQ